MTTTEEIEDQIELARVGFDEDLHRLMRKEGLSRRQLAKKVGVSPAYISKLMNGYGNYTLKTMAKIALALDAIVEVRLAQQPFEAVRVVSHVDARSLDERRHRPGRRIIESDSSSGLADVISISTQRKKAAWRRQDIGGARHEQRA